MSTITKEQLRERAREKVKSLEFSITQTAFADSRAELEEELELARIALASLEAEPVGYMNRFTGRVFTLEEQPGADTDAKVYVPVYAAPPAPECLTRPVHPRISSEELDDETLDELIDFRRCTFEYHSQQDNKVQTIIHGVTLTAMLELRDRRAAMLQSGNSPAQSDCCPAQNCIAPAQGGNYPVIPDGWVACSERMPEENAEQEVLACFKGGDISTLYYFEGRWDDAYGIVPIRQDVTHWIPLPAAPQQEVKS